MLIKQKAPRIESRGLFVLKRLDLTDYPSQIVNLAAVIV